MGEEQLKGKPLIETAQVDATLIGASSDSRVVATGYDFEYRTCVNHFELRQTADGNIIFVNPQPKAAALDVIYPPEYIPFQFSTMKGPARLARDFLQGGKARAILKLAGPQGKILDVGCGAGSLLRQLVRLGGNKANIYGNDFSEEALAPLRAEGFNTIAGTVEELALEQQFEVITMLQVLEHMDNPAQVLQKLGRLLKPGGYLFIETPSIDGLDAHLFKNRYWGGYHIPRHFWLFNETSLRQQLAQAGLELAQVKYMCSPAFWIQSVHHLLFDKGWLRVASFFSEKNPALLAFFTLLDSGWLVLGRKTSNIRVVARKAR